MYMYMYIYIYVHVHHVFVVHSLLGCYGVLSGCWRFRCSGVAEGVKVQSYFLEIELLKQEIKGL